MFELPVLSEGVNFALNKTASQSSTLGNKTASLAVDGSETTFLQTMISMVFGRSTWEVHFLLSLSRSKIAGAVILVTPMGVFADYQVPPVESPSSRYTYRL